MNILLTGSSGFIGRHLLPLLGKDSWQIWHLVRETKGLSNEIIWDFKSELSLNIPKIDIIVHLAAKPYFGSDLDMEQYDVNAISALELVNLAKKNGAFFIFASAAIVNGDAALVDRATPVQPLSHYATTKMLAETIIARLTEEYVFLRIGGVYGLDGPEHLGLNRSISQAYHRQSQPTLRGNGQTRRNYICVEDVAKWIESIICQWESGASFEERILYLAGPEVLTLREYLILVTKALTKFEEPIVEQGTPAGDFLLKADIPAFKLTTFNQYLSLLASQRKKYA